MSDDVEQVKEEARAIYEATQCAMAGCCGDLEGALEHVVKRLTEAAPEEEGNTP